MTHSFRTTRRGRIARRIGALAVALVVIGCNKDKGAAAGATTSKLVVGPLPPFAKADVDFMQGMIGHHAQAIVMAAMAPTHGASKQVLTLCKKIDISQRDEINSMTQWLKDRKQAVPDPNTPMAMAMPGMLSPEQMKQLDAAKNADFDRLFLTFMIQHHEGALSMVKTLFATPGAGQASEMFRYATDVMNDQTAEIERMQSMLSASPTRESDSK